MQFLLGLGIGYTVGILVAPCSGRDLRARLKKRIDSNARAKAREIGARAGEIAYEELKKTL